ncbi:DUF4355 domain-containing protein [Anaerostipes caccae]|uniref:DUF4355 domain-containing protein n=1 Tax=Anaerostipes caccae TaxID=105841 RepID=UPI0038D3C9F7
MKLKNSEQSKFPMNLQFFAEGEGDGAGGDQGGGAGDAGKEGGDRDGKDSTPSFDDILKGNKDYQAEFDRRIQKGIQTAITTEKEKWEILTDDKVSEAEKLAKMNKEEKAQYLQEKKEKDIQAREAAITKRELAAEAKNTLAEKGLPPELAEVLNYSDADSCKQSISAVEKAFQKAVEKAVEEKLKGGQPPKNPQDQGSDLQKEIEKAMMGH